MLESLTKGKSTKDVNIVYENNKVYRSVYHLFLLPFITRRIGSKG